MKTSVHSGRAASTTTTATLHAHWFAPEEPYLGHRPNSWIRLGMATNLNLGLSAPATNQLVCPGGGMRQYHGPTPLGQDFDFAPIGYPEGLVGKGLRLRQSHADAGGNPLPGHIYPAIYAADCRS